MNSYARGKYAEFLARLFMRLHGYNIICCNYVTGRGTNAGEIDFIAKRGKTLVFVEVKERKDLDTAAYAISTKQKNRIVYGAKCFIKNNQCFSSYNIRFDVILVSFPFKIRYIKNAWIEL